MKSRIQYKFEELKKKGQKALIPYITCGDPDMNTTENLVKILERAGADIIELGIPYSDPLADGPIIQGATQRALKNNINIDSILDMIKELRKETSVPLVFLTYYNSIYRFGIRIFLERCKEVGIDGLIIPDLPLEERKEFFEISKNFEIDLIPMVAPTSDKRIKELVEIGSGFVYCISSKGVTGKRKSFEEGGLAFIKEIKKHSSIPMAIGFGISNEDAVLKLKEMSDGLIVGSSIVEKIEEGIKYNDVEKRVYSFVKRLSDAIK